MKRTLLAASMFLCAAAAQAEEIYKVEAQLQVNGKVVGVYSADVPEGVTGQVNDLLLRPYTDSITVSGGKVVKKVVKNLETGFRFQATPRHESDGKTILRYNMDYSRLEKMDSNPVNNSEASIDQPITNDISGSGTLVFENGEPQESSGSDKHGAWELVMSVSKR